LKQDGNTVSGTVAMPTQHVGERKEIELKGEFAAGVLKISGVVEGAADPTTIEIEGTLQEDGSMEGTLAMIGKETRRVPWTAERWKERRPCPRWRGGRRGAGSAPRPRCRCSTRCCRREPLPRRRDARA